jgi:hypothetical protein
VRVDEASLVPDRRAATKRVPTKPKSTGMEPKSTGMEPKPTGMEPQSTGAATTTSVSGSVQSWELLMDNGTINYRERATETFRPVNDSTNSEYLNRAEDKLGKLEPLRILAKWKVLPAGSGHAASGAWWRSHLIGAEFGGQKKYRTAPEDNVRYHPQELEQGEWQQAERYVKKWGKQGQFAVDSKESHSAASLAARVVAVVEKDIPSDKKPALEKALAATLKAANYVASFVRFAYVDVAEDKASFTKEWPNQDALLRVEPGATRDAVWNALTELRDRGWLKVDDFPVVPKDVTIGSTKFDIRSFNDLNDFLLLVFDQSANPRLGQIRTAIS